MNGRHTSNIIQSLVLGFCAYIYLDNYNKHQNTPGLHKDTGEEVKRMKNTYLEEYELEKIKPFHALITLIQEIGMCFKSKLKLESLFQGVDLKNRFPSHLCVFSRPLVSESTSIPSFCVLRTGLERRM